MCQACHVDTREKSLTSYSQVGYFVYCEWRKFYSEKCTTRFVEKTPTYFREFGFLCVWARELSDSGVAKIGVGWKRFSDLWGPLVNLPLLHNSLQCKGLRTTRPSRSGLIGAGGLGCEGCRGRGVSSY